MLAAGTPDGRPERLADELERLLGGRRDLGPDPARGAGSGGRRSRAARRGLPEVRAAAGRLAASGIAATIQHDDLHGGNIFVGPDGDRIFDWGDAVVAHPFGTLTTTFNSIAHHTGRSPDDPVFARLLDVYTEAWTDVAPRTELVETAALARSLGCIGKSLALGARPDRSRTR